MDALLYMYNDVLFATFTVTLFDSTPVTFVAS